jgi:hypothetical protein
MPIISGCLTKSEKADLSEALGMALQQLKAETDALNQNRANLPNVSRFLEVSSDFANKISVLVASVKEVPECVLQAPQAPQALVQETQQSQTVA